MPLNSVAFSFVPLAPVPQVYPAARQPNQTYSNLTTAQCAANGALTSKAVTSSGVLVEGATARANGMIIIVPTDQPQVTFGNDDPISGQLAMVPIQAIPAVTTFAQQVTNSGAAASNNGFALPPGVAMHLSPFNDPMYAITPTGVSATIYFVDPAAGTPL